MCIGIIVGKLLNNWMLTIGICGVIGLMCMGIAGLLNVLFVNETRNRVNSLFDTKDANINKNSLTYFSFVVAVPNIVLAVILFLITKH